MDGQTNTANQGREHTLASSSKRNKNSYKNSYFSFKKLFRCNGLTHGAPNRGAPRNAWSVGAREQPAERQQPSCTLVGTNSEGKQRSQHLCLRSCASTLCCSLPGFEHPLDRLCYSSIMPAVSEEDHDPFGVLRNANTVLLHNLRRDELSPELQKQLTATGMASTSQAYFCDPYTNSYLGPQVTKAVSRRAQQIATLFEIAGGAPGERHRYCCWCHPQDQTVAGTRLETFPLQ